MSIIGEKTICMKRQYETLSFIMPMSIK